MIEALRNALRLADVRNKLLITGLILVVYQFAAHVPVVGVDRQALQEVLAGGSGIVEVLNLLSGGGVRNFSVIANGVYPYITASIIFQLLVPIVPALEAIQREPGGQEKIQRYTYYLAIPMAIVQAVGQIQIFTVSGGGTPIIPNFGIDPILTLAVIATMTAGTMFAIWLGELITEQGIGNGLSIIIFSGIVAQAPGNLFRLLQSSTHAGWDLILFLIIVVVSVVGIVFIQEGVRRIPVQYGKRVRGRKQYGGASTHIPMRVNPVGMIPLIFAQSIITFPAIIASVLPAGAIGDYFSQTFGNQQGFTYWFVFFALVVGFTFLYTDIMVLNQNLADNLQRQGGFIPGIRPGKRTQDYIVTVTRRITLVGALFLGVIAVVPGLVNLLNSFIFPNEVITTGSNLNAASVLTGSGLVIVVGVVIDTMRQLEAQLVMRNYEGFMN
jgi:preprotein translocase subunit SecY